MTGVEVGERMRVTAEDRAPSGLAFEGLASEYDARFTDGFIGRLLRSAVWRRLDVNFRPGSRILDLGCGTGEDAVYLARQGIEVVAIDSAAAMVEAARRKAEAAGLADQVRVGQLAIEALVGEHVAMPGGGGPGAAGSVATAFDGALSNFGALNCCTIELPSLARGLARYVKPGSPVVLVVMGPLVPWEWAWFLLRGEPRKAFRRLRRDGLEWRGMMVRYPSIRTLRRAFKAEFGYRRVSALGALIPPAYAQGWAQRNPRLVHTLARWERRLERLRPLAWLADHYVLELERR